MPEHRLARTRSSYVHDDNLGKNNICLHTQKTFSSVKDKWFCPICQLYITTTELTANPDSTR